MADHMSYEDAKRFVYRGLFLLAGITLLEVFISLASKGFIPGLRWMEDYTWVAYVAALGLVGLSLYKAYFIVYDFMHMRAEVGSLAATVLLPMTLLFWAMVAFFQEGSMWGARRELIADKNAIEVQAGPEAAVSPIERSEGPNDGQTQQDRAADQPAAETVD